ncbi:phytanoyl-CoA dioxygenase [Tanacetum coccineum]
MVCDGMLMEIRSEKAFDAGGKLEQREQLSMNKVGHALHDHDPRFKKVYCSDKMSGILHSLGYKKPVIIQSLLVYYELDEQRKSMGNKDIAIFRVEHLCPFPYIVAALAGFEETGSIAVSIQPSSIEINNFEEQASSTEDRSFTEPSSAEMVLNPCMHNQLWMPSLVTHDSLELLESSSSCRKRKRTPQEDPKSSQVLGDVKGGQVTSYHGGACQDGLRLSGSGEGLFSRGTWKPILASENEGISMGGGTRAVREPRVVVQTTSDIDILDDGSIAAARREQVEVMKVQRKLKIAHYGRLTSAKCNVHSMRRRVQLSVVTTLLFAEETLTWNPNRYKKKGIMTCTMVSHDVGFEGEMWGQAVLVPIGLAKKESAEKYRCNVEDPPAPHLGLSSSAPLAQQYNHEVVLSKEPSHTSSKRNFLIGVSEVAFIHFAPRRLKTLLQRSKGSSMELLCCFAHELRKDHRLAFFVLNVGVKACTIARIKVSSDCCWDEERAQQLVI